MSFVEVGRPKPMICCKCGCGEGDTKMRYVYFANEELVKAYCADHYREWMIAVHGEETVKMLEESTAWRDVLSTQDV